MREMLTRKVFGKIPVWMILIVAFGVGYFMFGRARRKPKTTGAEDADADPRTPMSYSAPDMFPLQGGGVGGPQGPEVGAGFSEVNQRLDTLLALERARHPGRTGPAQKVSNRPSYQRMLRREMIQVRKRHPRSSESAIRTTAKRNIERRRRRQKKAS